MKISLRWVHDYLEGSVSQDEADVLLTRQGFPLDGIEPIQASDDVMLDVEVTSNRPDCLSHIGVARELAAGSSATLKLPDIDPPESGEMPPADSLTSVTLDASQTCPYYTARVIRNVKVGPSPDWLVSRLEAVGLRSVNNVVDVTNFVMLEMGQPLHAFDMAKLAEQRIVVRNAARGETIVAIDGSRHQLLESDLVIADATRPVAVAGVMGGLDTEVSDATTDVLLESAVFDPVTVRRTGRRLKLASDSSYRFERGVDPVGVERASARAARLICQLGDAALAPGVVVAGEVPSHGQAVALRTERCRKLMGMAIEDAEMVRLLAPLDLSPRFDASKGVINCTVPSFRLDLHREVDLIEEVARMHGLDDLTVQPTMSIVAAGPPLEQTARQMMDHVLTGRGYFEAITFAFLSRERANLFVPEGAVMAQVADERRKAEPALRPSIVPSLLASRKLNQDAGNHQVMLYEIGSSWLWRGDELHEARQLTMIADVTGKDPTEDYRQMRGAIEQIVAQLSASQASMSVEPTHSASDARVAGYETVGRVRVADKPAGVIGVVAPQVIKTFGLQQRAIACELSFPALVQLYPPEPRVQGLARFPAIERDLSVVVDEPVSWQQIRETVLATEPDMLEQLEFVTVYRGKPVSAGQKSMSLRMVFRDPSGTLRHEQVDPQVAQVVDRLSQTLGATLRQ